MTPTIAVTTHLAGYATQLIGLGAPAAHQSNFLFGPSIADSDVLINAIKNRAVYPALMLEYPDNNVDYNNQTGMVETLQFGLSVIAYIPARDDVYNIADVIYETCKPLADRVIARLQKDSDAKNLGIPCEFKLQLLRNYNGNWAGPVANNVYGYRYDINIRVFGSDFSYSAAHWEL